MAQHPKNPNDKGRDKRDGNQKVKPTANSNTTPPNETVRKEQQRQWISDHVMWEAVLGIRDDDAVNNLMGPVDDPKPLIESEQPVAKPGTDIRQQAGKLKQKQTQHSQHQKQLHKPQNPAPKNQSSQAPVRPVLKPAPPPIRQPQPVKPKQMTSGAHSNQQQRSTSPRPGSSKNTQSQPMVSSSRAQVAQYPVKQKAPPAQTQAPPQPAAAVFEAKEANRNFNYQIQDANEIRKIQRRAKIKYSFEFLFSVLKQHWKLVSVLLFGFLVGYVVGASTTSDTMYKKMVTKEEIDALIQKAKKSTNEALKIKNTASKISPPIKTPRKSDNQIQQPVQTVNTAPGNAQSTQSQRQNIIIDAQFDSNQPTAQQYEGVDIQIAPTDQVETNTIAGNSDTEKTEQQALDQSSNVTPLPESQFESENSQETPQQITNNQQATLSTASSANETQPALTEEAIANVENLVKENLQKFQNHEWEAVIDLSNQIIAMNPNAISALINRSVAYTELGMYDLALNDCFLAIELDPNNPLAINNRGYTYEKMGNIEQAINDYATACGLGVEISCKEVKRLKENASLQQNPQQNQPATR